MPGRAVGGRGHVIWSVKGPVRRRCESGSGALRDGELESAEFEYKPPSHAIFDFVYVYLILSETFASPERYTNI